MCFSCSKVGLPNSSTLQGKHTILHGEVANINFVAGFDIKRLSDCPEQVKTASNLFDRASENDSVICSISEEQND
jgi:hypothetical protein